MPSSISHMDRYLVQSWLRLTLFVCGVLIVLLGVYATGPRLVAFGTEYFSPDRQLSEESIAVLYRLQMKIIVVGALLLTLSFFAQTLINFYLSLKTALVRSIVARKLSVLDLTQKVGLWVERSISVASRVIMNEKTAWFLVILMLLAFDVPSIYMGTHFHAEGIDLNPAKNLARHGIYATLTTGGFDEFTYRISAGPGILIPQAIVFKLFGIDVYHARALQVIYGLALVLAFYLVGRTLYGSKVAVLSLLMFTPIFLIDNRGASAGYPVAMFYFLLGSLFWWKSIERKMTTYLVASGVLWGLAFQTKWLFLFSICAVVLTWVIVRFCGNQLSSRYWVVPAATVLVLTAGWVGFRVYQLGVREEYFHLVRFWHEHWHRAAGAGVLADAAGLLPAFLSVRPVISLSQVDLWGELQLFLFVPAVLYTFILAVKGNSNDHKSLLVLGFVSLWFLWWLILSYDLHSTHWDPVRMLSQLFIGKLLYDLWSWSRDRSGSLVDHGPQERGGIGLRFALRAVIATVVATAVVVPLAGKYRDLYGRNAALAGVYSEMIAYVRENTEKDAVFSGWAWSLPWHVDLDDARDRIIKDRSTYLSEQREDVAEYFIVSPEWPLSEEPSELPNVAPWNEEWTQRENAKRIAFLEKHTYLVKEFPAGRHKWMLFKIKDNNRFNAKAK